MGYKVRMQKPAHPDPHHHTVTAEPEDRRGALELSDEENADMCRGCVRCCSYITVEIDAPRAAWEYDQWIWALYHRGISLYVEKPERWYLHVDTVCEKLGAEGRCSIHGRHPVLCREYDPRTCERRLPLADVRAWFDSGEQLEAWVERERPSHWRRLMAYRKDMPPGPPVADARIDRARSGALVPLDALVESPAPARRGRRRAPRGGPTRGKSSRAGARRATSRASTDR